MEAQKMSIQLFASSLGVTCLPLRHFGAHFWWHCPLKRRYFYGQFLDYIGIPTVDQKPVDELFVN